MHRVQTLVTASSERPFRPFFDGEGQGVTNNKVRESQSRTLPAVSLDPPSGSITHDRHLASLPPPTVHLARQSDPQCSLFAQSSEMLQSGRASCRERV